MASIEDHRDWNWRKSVAMSRRWADPEWRKGQLTAIRAGLTAFWANADAAERCRQRKIASQRKLDYDAALDLWAQGLGSPEIARRLGFKRGATVRTIVQRARRDGDPRAKARA